MTNRNPLMFKMTGLFIKLQQQNM